MRFEGAAAGEDAGEPGADAFEDKPSAPSDPTIS